MNRTIVGSAPLVWGVVRHHSCELITTRDCVGAIH